MRRATPKDWLEYIIAKPYVCLMQMLPLSVASRVASFIGYLLFDVIRYRRDVTLDNLRQSLGQFYSPRDLIKIARRSYSNFALLIADLARLPLVDMDFISRHIRIKGLRFLDDLRRRGTGAVLVTGHFGSWELMGCTLVKLGYPVVFVVGIQRNPLVQDLMNSLRRKAGIEIIERKATLAIARNIRKGKFVAMLSDQDAGRNGIFVDFFGRPASTPKGPARLALIANAPIVPGFIIREDLTSYTITIEKPIEISEDRRPAVRNLTQTYTSIIEDFIRAKPDHWLWSHRRWKTKPA